MIHVDKRAVRKGTQNTERVWHYIALIVVICFEIQPVFIIITAYVTLTNTIYSGCENVTTVFVIAFEDIL